MTAPSDLIRRDAVLALVRSYHPADGACCFEDPDGHSAAVWACDGIATRIEVLPADPVGEAAGKLAAATLVNFTNLGARVNWTMIDAAIAYRAAVAARDAGEPR